MLKRIKQSERYLIKSAGTLQTVHHNISCLSLWSLPLTLVQHWHSSIPQWWLFVNVEPKWTWLPINACRLAHLLYCPSYVKLMRYPGTRVSDGSVINLDLPLSQFSQRQQIQLRRSGSPSLIWPQPAAASWRLCHERVRSCLHMHTTLTVQAASVVRKHQERPRLLTVSVSSWVFFHRKTSWFQIHGNTLDRSVSKFCGSSIGRGPYVIQHSLKFPSAQFEWFSQFGVGPQRTLTSTPYKTFGTNHKDKRESDLITQCLTSPMLLWLYENKSVCSLLFKNLQRVFFVLKWDVVKKAKNLDCNEWELYKREKESIPNFISLIFI